MFPSTRIPFWVRGFDPQPQLSVSAAQVGKVCLAFVLSIMVAFEPILNCAVAQAGLLKKEREEGGEEKKVDA